LTASFISTALVLLLSVPAAYALSIRPIFKVQDALFFFISTRFMPAAASILPMYIIFKNLLVRFYFEHDLYYFLIFRGFYYKLIDFKIRH
jgi:ABC-type glycerol-3-phosphate transport system permease component